MNAPADVPVAPPEILTAVAEQLRIAETLKAPITPITADHPELTVADAYTIQAINTAMREQAGAEIVGHKIGLTAKAMQQMLGVTEPDYGVMFHDTQLRSGDAVTVGELISPRVEPEIAFVLGEDLAGDEVSAEQVLAATAYIVPSLEVIDSRIADWKITLIDTIADNASYGRIVLGTQHTDPADVSLAAAMVTLQVDGREVDRGSGAAVLGHPAKAVAWLATTLAGYGVTLRAGQVILPGSMTAAIPLTAGHTVRADFGPLGHVEVTAR